MNAPHLNVPKKITDEALSLVTHLPEMTSPYKSNNDEINVKKSEFKDNTFV